MIRSKPAPVNSGSDVSWAAIPLEEALRLAETTEHGLTTSVAGERLSLVGPNELPTGAGVNPLRLFIQQMTHTLALLLWAAVGVAFLAQLQEIAWAIVAILIINGAFSFWQEYRASQVVAALGRQIPRAARVLRDATEHRIPARELVPGDVLVLRAGELIPGDARVIEASDLHLDYSILTGESEAVERTPAAQSLDVHLADASNCVLAGSTIVRGSGLGMVFATGASTEFGEIAILSARTVKHASPLHKQLNDTARAIAVVAVVTGALFFIVGYLGGGVSTNDSFVFALGILVALIPEGLLPTVSLSLAMGVQRMSRRHALVKQLSSVDTLGCTDVICTDKTGTMTLNEMTARLVWVEDACYLVAGHGYSLEGAVELKEGFAAASQTLALLLRCTVLCNDGIRPDTLRNRAGLGDPLDEGLLVLAMKADVAPDEVRASARRLEEFPFEADRRRMSTVHASPGGMQVFVKGGPVEVLERCTSEEVAGSVRPLFAERRSELRSRVDAMTTNGLRILGFAYREVTALPTGVDDAERELIFLGLVGLDNPLRPEVPAAVRRCHEAGITVVMLTGDHAQTALSVAVQAGLIEAGDSSVVAGTEIESLTDSELDALLVARDPKVFARVTPAEKLRLVNSYKRLGKVVAVTGDGVNDAPALRAADIGVAMGMRGTDVAREAADIVLLDDNFATIVSAIEEGRAVYANIRKFLTYFLTSNVAEALPFVAFVLFRVPLPLIVLQVLLVDLGTDLLPGLALGVEGPEPGTMKEKPRGMSRHIVTRGLLVRALGWLGMLAATLSLTGYFVFQRNVTGHLGDYVDHGALYRQATTITLVGIVACQVGNVFACRSERISVFRLGVATNRALLGAVAAEVAMIAVLIAVPPFRDIFDLEPIEPRYWPLLASFPLVFLAIEELRKWLFAMLPKLRQSQGRDLL
ncbi:MAG: cation-transporting P-type ATPase [Chloroflexota bacterium]